MIAKTAPNKAWARIVGCLAFAGFGLFVALRPDAGLGLNIFGWFIVAFFLGMVLMQLRLALATGPQVIIDELGVLDRRIADRYVPWSEVRGVTEVIAKRQRFLYLDVGPNAGRFTEHPGKKLLLWINQFPVRGVLINPHGLDIGIDQLRAEIERRMASR